MTPPDPLTYTITADNTQAMAALEAVRKAAVAADESLARLELNKQAAQQLVVHLTIEEPQRRVVRNRPWWRFWQPKP